VSAVFRANFALATGPHRRKRRIYLVLSTPYVNHDADLGWVWGMMFFVSPVISSAERGLHVKTERRLVPPCWAAFFCAAAGCNQDDYQRTGGWRRGGPHFFKMPIAPGGPAVR
jgi:hypothetical protein